MQFGIKVIRIKNMDEKKKKFLFMAALVILWSGFVYFLGDKVLHGIPGNILFTEKVVSISIDSINDKASVEAYMLYENNGKSRGKLKLFYPVHIKEVSLLPVHTDRKVPFPARIEMKEFRDSSENISSLFRLIENAAKIKEEFPEINFQNKEFTVSDIGVFATLNLDPGESSIYRVRYTQDSVDFYSHHMRGADRHFGYSFTTNTGWGRGIDKATYVINHETTDFINVLVSPGAFPNYFRKRLLDEKNVKPGIDKETQQTMNYQVIEATDFIDRGISVVYGRYRDEH
jgi:hypothetical protein